MRNLNTITTRVGIPVFQHREDVNPTMFISLDTTMEQWCQQIEDAYAGVLTGLEEEEDADAGSQ